MKTLISSSNGGECYDLNLGLAIKGKRLIRCGPRLSLGVAFSCPGSVKECEGKNPHTPK